mmetsp:Transcript_19163/g.44044  ORF Transcript_19163/g.44044 Transcript_19163/m.44044 type:complete len:531 (-) Transcript_19163:159-1751(-)
MRGALQRMERGDGPAEVDVLRPRQGDADDARPGGARSLAAERVAHGERAHPDVQRDGGAARSDHRRVHGSRLPPRQAHHLRVRRRWQGAGTARHRAARRPAGGGGGRHVASAAEVHGPPQGAGQAAPRQGRQHQRRARAEPARRVPRHLRRRHARGRRLPPVDAAALLQVEHVRRGARQREARARPDAAVLHQRPRARLLRHPAARLVPLVVPRPRRARRRPVLRLERGAAQERARGPPQPGVPVRLGHGGPPHLAAAAQAGLHHVLLEQGAGDGARADEHGRAPRAAHALVGGRAADDRARARVGHQRPLLHAARVLLDARRLGLPDGRVRRDDRARARRRLHAARPHGAPPAAGGQGPRSRRVALLGVLLLAAVGDHVLDAWARPRDLPLAHGEQLPHVHADRLHRAARHLHQAALRVQGDAQARRRLVVRARGEGGLGRRLPPAERPARAPRRRPRRSHQRRGRLRERQGRGVPRQQRGAALPLVPLPADALRRVGLPRVALPAPVPVDLPRRRARGAAQDHDSRRL